MPASATYKTYLSFRDNLGRLRRCIRVDITGLANGANTIAHGITQPNQPSVGATPKDEFFVPTSAVTAHCTQFADATNLYYTIDAGAGTTASVFLVV
jgi:hypothetical protein